MEVVFSDGCTNEPRTTKTFLGILWRHYQREVLANLTCGIHFDFCFWGFLGDKYLDFLHRLAPSLNVIRKNKVIVAAEKELLRLRLVLYEEVGRIKRFGKLFFGHDVRIIGRLLTNRTKHLDSPLEPYFVSFGKENKSNRDNSQNDKHDHTENIRADMSDDTYAIYDDNAP